jgi:transcriptional regulator with XRE-family HTH domain
MKLTLKEWRRARGKTQEEMAQLCNVHINTYRRWEDNPGEIKYDNAILIADHLNIGLDDILFPSNITETDISTITA